MRTITFFLLFLTTASCYGQEKKDSLAIGFLFSKSPVRDNSGMTLRVVYKNLTNREVTIYRTLQEGGLPNDRFANIYVVLEKKKNGNFAEYSTNTFDINPAIYYNMEIDSLRHFDLPKKTLAPFSADTLTLNLLKAHSLIDTGEYRLNADLRVRTIRDNTPYSDPNGEKTPPFDKLFYKSSGWIYFRVERVVSMRPPGRDGTR